jgi:hypothetical protein
MSTLMRRAFLGRVFLLGTACTIVGCGPNTGDVAPTTDATKNKHLRDVEEAKKKAAAKK